MRRDGVLLIPWAVLVAVSLALGACGETRSTAAAEEVRSAEAAGLEAVRLHSPDITCYGCVAAMKRRLEELGVSAISGDAKQKIMTGYFDADRLTPAEIRAAIEELGYRIERLETGADARRVS